jgi:hypothetical protein
VHGKRKDRVKEREREKEVDENRERETTINNHISTPFHRVRVLPDILTTPPRFTFLYNIILLYIKLAL